MFGYDRAETYTLWSLFVFCMMDNPVRRASVYQQVRPLPSLLLQRCVKDTLSFK